MTDTETKWAERVREWKASGQTAKEFVAGRDFKASTLVYWASCLKTGTKRQKKERRVPMGRVVRVAAAPDAAIVVSVGVARVSVGTGFDPILLRKVVLALSEGS